LPEKPNESYGLIMQHTDVQHFHSSGSAPTISALLRRDIDEYAAEARKTNRLLQRARTGELAPYALGRYLRSIHYLLRHTPIHLSLAEQRANELGHTEVAEYFALKRAEEAGHDRWAEADMERFAAKFNVAIPTEHSAIMMALVAANEAVIRNNPLHYLGYILFAEYFMVVMGPEWLRALAENCGVPGSLMTAIGNHVELDKDHVEEGCAEIDALVSIEYADSFRMELRGMMGRFAAFCDDLCET
jgi:hypothetical protein